MTTRTQNMRPVLQAVEEALEMLGAYDDWDARLPRTDAPPLSSLLEQCRQAIKAVDAEGPEPMRCIHHFASTGGTLISKCLAAAPNTVLLSEVDPFSTLQIDREQTKFAPTDLIRLIRYNTVRPIPDDVLGDVFLAGLGALYRALSQSGQRIVLRDHAHSQYCLGPEIADRPTVRALLQRDFRVVSAITVRHPLDSFLSLSQSNWLHFLPQTLEEYSRRYLRFLDDCNGLEILKYEDFVAAPTSQIAKLCRVLELPFENVMLDNLDLFRLTGDSGRSGSRIETRVRRPVPAEIRDEAESVKSYHSLCTRLDYAPSP